jgi:flagellar hook-length control protein FliK
LISVDLLSVSLPPAQGTATSAAANDAPSSPAAFVDHLQRASQQNNQRSPSGLGDRADNSSSAAPPNPTPSNNSPPSPPTDKAPTNADTSPDAQATKSNDKTDKSHDKDKDESQTGDTTVAKDPTTAVDPKDPGAPVITLVGAAKEVVDSDADSAAKTQEGDARLADGKGTGASPSKLPSVPAPKPDNQATAGGNSTGPQDVDTPKTEAPPVAAASVPVMPLLAKSKTSTTASDSQADTKPPTSAVANGRATPALPAQADLPPIPEPVASAANAKHEAKLSGASVTSDASTSNDVAQQAAPADVLATVVAAVTTALPADVTVTPPAENAKSGVDAAAKEKASGVPSPDSSTTTAPTAGPPAASSQATSVGAHAARKSDPSTDGSTIDRERFIERVSRAFQAANDRGSPLRLRLSPPELGSLRLEIRVDQGGQVSARLEAETPAARSMLLDSLPALRDRLEQQDIKVTRFDVDLLDQSPGGLPNNPDGRFARDNQPSGGSPRTPSMPSPTTVDTLPVATPSKALDNGRLNVLI